MASCVHTLRDVEVLFFRPVHAGSTGPPPPPHCGGYYFPHSSPSPMLTGPLRGGREDVLRNNGRMEWMEHKSSHPYSRDLDEMGMLLPPPLSVVLKAIENNTPWSEVMRSQWGTSVKGTKKENEDMLHKRRKGSPDTHQGANSFSLLSPLAHTIPVSYHPVYFLCWGREDRDEMEEFYSPYPNGSSHHRLHTSSSSSPWCVHAEREYRDAEKTAHQLGLIPSTQSLPTLDLRGEYQEECFLPLLNAYAKGETFNVDVACNAKIKFGAALEQMWERWNAEATVVDEEGDEESVDNGVQGNVTDWRRKDKTETMMKVMNSTNGRKGSSSLEDSHFGASPCTRMEEEKEGGRRKRKENKKEVRPLRFLVTGHYARMCSYLSPPTDVSSCSPLVSHGSTSTSPQPYSSSHLPPSFIRILSKPYTAGDDPRNDQVHFLACVHPNVLSSTALFPLGHLFRSKAEVRQVAAHFSHLLGHVAEKKTSTGICMLHLHRPSVENFPTKQRTDHRHPDRGAGGASACFSSPCNDGNPCSALSHTPKGEDGRPTSSLGEAAKPSLRFPLFLSSHMGEVKRGGKEEEGVVALVGGLPSCIPSSFSSFSGTRFFDKDRGEYLNPHHFSWSSSTRQFLQGFRTSTSGNRMEDKNSSEEENFFFPAYLFTLGQKLQYMRRTIGVNGKKKTGLRDGRESNEKKKEREQKMETMKMQEGLTDAKIEWNGKSTALSSPLCSSTNTSSDICSRSSLGNQEKETVRGGASSITNLHPLHSDNSRRNCLCSGSMSTRAIENRKRGEEKGRGAEKIECVTYYVCEKKVLIPVRKKMRNQEEVSASFTRRENQREVDDGTLRWHANRISPTATRESSGVQRTRVDMNVGAVEKQKENEEDAKEVLSWNGIQEEAAMDATRTHMQDPQGRGEVLPKEMEEEGRKRKGDENGGRTAFLVPPHPLFVSPSSSSAPSPFSSCEPAHYAPLLLSEVVLVSGSHEHPSLMYSTTYLKDVKWHIPVVVPSTEPSSPASFSSSSHTCSHLGAPVMRNGSLVWCSPQGRSASARGGDRDEDSSGGIRVKSRMPQNHKLEWERRGWKVSDGEQREGKTVKEEGGGARSGLYSTTCLCAIRHQDVLHLARVWIDPCSSFVSSSLSPADSAKNSSTVRKKVQMKEKGKEEAVKKFSTTSSSFSFFPPPASRVFRSTSSSTCTAKMTAKIEWLTPRGVRCPAPGQLVVMYVPPPPPSFLWGGDENGTGPFIKMESTSCRCSSMEDTGQGGRGQEGVLPEGWVGTSCLPDGNVGNHCSCPFGVVLFSDGAVNDAKEGGAGRMESLLQPYLSGDLSLSHLLVLGSGWVQ